MTPVALSHCGLLRQHVEIEAGWKRLQQVGALVRWERCRGLHPPLWGVLLRGITTSPLSRRTACVHEYHSRGASGGRTESALA